MIKSCHCLIILQTLGGREDGGWDRIWICSGINWLWNWLWICFWAYCHSSFLIYLLLVIFMFSPNLPSLHLSGWSGMEMEKAGKVTSEETANCEGDSLMPTWCYVHDHSVWRHAFPGSEKYYGMQMSAHNLLICSFSRLCSCVWMFCIVYR